MLIASDGPRVMPEVPTIATGTRGIFNFDLVVDLRPGGVHSGHWGGLTTDPAVVLSHALGAIIDRRGKILVRDWLPPNGVPAAVRAVLAAARSAAAAKPPLSTPTGANPALPLPRKSTAGTALSCLRCSLAGRRTRSMLSPRMRAAHCQIRYTVDSDPADFRTALRRHLDEQGFPDVRVENAARAHAGKPHRSPHPGSAGPSAVWNSRWASGCR